MIQVFITCAPLEWSTYNEPYTGYTNDSFLEIFRVYYFLQWSPEQWSPEVLYDGVIWLSWFVTLIFFISEWVIYNYDLSSLTSVGATKLREAKLASCAQLVY
jgi:hypothetical protein